MTRYRALVGLSYGDRHVQPGHTADDIPEESVTWLLADGLIEEVEEKKPPAKAERTAGEKSS